MMGAESLFGNLSLHEKTAIMAVLSRDRQIRETEEERVMKLRIELGRERRDGALVAGRDTSQRKRTCARCRDKIGILESGRCPICKHIVCKKCRVYRSIPASLKYDHHSFVEEDGRGSEGGVCSAEGTDQLEIPQTLARTESSSSYPKDLNPFETCCDEICKMPEKATAKLQETVCSSNDLPLINYDVIDGAVMTSTPCDPRLGRSLVGGDTGAMISPAKLGLHKPIPEKEKHSHSSGQKSNTDLSHVKSTCQNFQTTKTDVSSGGPNGNDQSLQTRRRLFDNAFDYQTLQTVHSSYEQKRVTGLSHGTVRSHLSLAVAEDSDSRHVLSDSTTYITAFASPTSKTMSDENDRGDFVGLNRKSRSTGYLPEFDEKEAVEFLMQIGTKHAQPDTTARSSEQKEEEMNEEDILCIEFARQIDSSVRLTTVEKMPDKSEAMLTTESTDIETHENMTEEKQTVCKDAESKQSSAKSMFTNAVNAIAKELSKNDFSKGTPGKSLFGSRLKNPFGLKNSDSKTAQKEPDSKTAQKEPTVSAPVLNPFAPRTSESKPPPNDSGKTNLMSLFSNPFSIKSVTTKPQQDGDKKPPFSFFPSNPISSKSERTDVVSKLKDMLLLHPPQPVQKQRVDNSAAKLFLMASKPNLKDVKESLDTSVTENEASHLEILSESKEQFEDVDPEKISLETPDSISLLLAESEADLLRVESRHYCSNPNSPFRTQKKMLSVSTDDAVGCMSEPSAPSDEENLGTKEVSSSDAPSTSSSDEYHYYHYARRKARISSKIRPPKYDGKLNAQGMVVKDSGYSTHDNYLRARSRYMRATRLSRRARARERDLRRLGKRVLGKSRLSRTWSGRRDSSTDLSNEEQIEDSDRNPPPSHTPYDAESANTNIMGRKGDSNRTATPKQSTTHPQQKEIQPDSGERTDQSRKKASSAKIFFEQLKSKMRLKPSDSDWVCRVCNKTLEVKKKSGDWFHSNTRPEVLQFKELLINNKRRMSDDAFVTPIRMTEYFQQEPSPLTVSPMRQNPEATSLLHAPLRRLRSNTLPCVVAGEIQPVHIGALSRSPSFTSLDTPTVDMSQLEASLQRQRRRMGKKSVAEVLHGTLMFHVPDPRAAGAPPPFVKKQTSVTHSVVSACVQDGPDDVTILRGNPISLCCILGGTSPLKSIWRKGKNEIKSSKQCVIDLTDKSAALTIKSSTRDDSGCYTLQVKNSAGVDQFSINVSVVDVPDPPGKPHASDIAGSALVLSWYGAGYDGGSTITGYRIEMADVTVSTKSPKWGTVSSAKSTSCTVKEIKPNSKYIFRVCAENKYGVSSPGQPSDVVLNTVTDVAESSEDEETFVKHSHVTVKTDGSFQHRYETKERLGQGRFGKVHRVINRDTGKEYAAKIMRALKAKDKDAVQQEIDIMNSLKHPRLVQLVDAYSQGREITMVMDLVSGGELFERVIDEDFELTEAACIKYMRQICDGLKYMHDAYILHLDLKPENIMCINKTGTQIKIIDFGLARKYNPKEIIRVMFGTPEFVAPEVINYDAIGPETDLWSVGVICYILLSGLSPFMGDNDAETLSNITAAEWDFDDESFDEISYDAKDFIRCLLVKSRGKRFNVDKAMSHKWLKKDTDKMSKSKLNTKNLKRFLARRKWQKTGNAVRALGRLASLANLRSSNSNAKKVSNGQPRQSGFLAALKAQLLRENEEEQEFHANCKPMFETLFDDVEVIEGSAAKFECTIVGTPDPEIMWFKDGEPIKESRHIRMSYTEDDVCTLLITDATEADEAEYTCKAVNVEGETEHRAELVVITPGV